MGFNKRYISEQNIRIIANRNNYIDFFNYFRSDVIISLDKFSSEIFDEISKYSIKDKNRIIKIMNKCKMEKVKNNHVIYTVVTVVLVIISVLIIFKDAIFK